MDVYAIHAALDIDGLLVDIISKCMRKTGITLQVATVCPTCYLVSIVLLTCVYSAGVIILFLHYARLFPNYSRIIPE